MKTKVGYNKIVNVMGSSSLFPDIGHTHLIHSNNQGRVYQNVKLHVMSSKRKYNSMMCINIQQLIVIVLRGYNAAFFGHCIFLFILC